MNTPGKNMTTPTPEQARKYANGMVPNSTVATMLRSLAEQVEVLTAERDAHIVEAARVDTGWRKANEVALETNRKNVALKDAARLALDALEQLIDLVPSAKRDCSCHISPPCSNCIDNSIDQEMKESGESAIAALKAVP